MRGMRWLRCSRAVAAMLVVPFLGNCGSGPPPTPPPAGGTLPSPTCPVIPTSPAPSCPGVALDGLTLTCSGPIVIRSDATRANRFGATLPNGSTVSGTVRAASAGPGEPCHGIGASSAIVITFGLEYIGDIGPSAPVCIQRSKVTFTQFEVGGGAFNPAWNPTVRPPVTSIVHLELDKALANSLRSTPTQTPRCANWQALP
jgi:hypothetical protein